ncbi:glycosyltransferase family 4 protein [Hyunsoonleella aestuarii]|uniref:Glycosyl transferase family 1 domain-containing protein n=1 Tax=Hyunsoonleella aestuarii TaxID=912802 RepID=A0ABP8E6W9_9FLAO|nr:glycosyltransferase [Hyunsoonleella aestuarii]
MKKGLTIISHTEHYKDTDGNIVGLVSTVTEINHLLEVFDEIYHVAMLHEGKAPPNTILYTSNKIKFIPIKALGGKGLKNKLELIISIPSVIGKVRKALKRTYYFQFRAPTGIGVFVIPYLLLSSKKGWFKYAGNWQQHHGPLAYQFQRWLLKKSNSLVTINGVWEGQPEHCKSFENPCLTSDELKAGERCISTKKFNKTSINFCFVGRLEDAKGVNLLMNAFLKLDKNNKVKIGQIHIVGKGSKMNHYKSLSDGSGLTFIFHNTLSRKEVHAIYKVSNAIILPSASEGFPKVVAEAMNYGCLPIVSNVSSIGQYVKDRKNGLLLNAISEEGLTEKLMELLDFTEEDYFKMIESSEHKLYKFTYEYYNNRIKNFILS